MNLNPPPQLRQAVYVLGVFLNAVVGYLTAAEVKLNIVMLALLAGYNAVMGLMAASNVSAKTSDPHGR